MNWSISHRCRKSAFTLLELLFVIVIIAIMISILVPGVGKMKTMAEAGKNTTNLREISMGTISWAQDNSGKLPSPQYPGGMTVPPNMSEEDYFPEHYNLGGTGLWIDGVVYAAIYKGEFSRAEVDANGNHLKGTVFVSSQSVKRNPEEKNYHKHSYAMNANLKHDRVYDTSSNSGDASLTEKRLSNITFGPNAMLYIENQDTNIVKFENREEIIRTSEERWDGGKIITGFVDGHVERLSQEEIPAGDPESDRDSSRFWRGVDP